MRDACVLRTERLVARRLVEHTRAREGELQRDAQVVVAPARLSRKRLPHLRGGRQASRVRRQFHAESVVFCPVTAVVL